MRLEREIFYSQDLILENRINHDSQILVIITKKHFEKHRDYIAEKLGNHNVELYLIIDEQDINTLSRIEKLVITLEKGKYSSNDLIYVIGSDNLISYVNFTLGLYKNYVEVINVPTTITAALNSASDNASYVSLNSEYKNSLFSFSNFSDIIINYNLFDDLEDIEKYQGIANILKLGLITNREGLSHLNHNQLKLAFEEIIASKLDIVNSLENTRTEVFNFGEVIGRALQQGYNLSKPAAIFQGMYFETLLLYRAKKIDRDIFNKIKNNILRYYSIDEQSLVYDVDVVFDYIVKNFINEDNEITFVTCYEIGDYVYVTFDRDELKHYMEKYLWNEGK